MARLDRLPGVKEVAQVGGLHRPRVRLRAARSVAAVPRPSCAPALDQLVAAELVFRARHAAGGDLHLQARAGAGRGVPGLLKRTRQQLHARIAQVLEERFPGGVAAEPEVIARHYDRRGWRRKRSAHYQLAGERAAQRSANEEAIGHLRRALDLVGTLAETRERHQRELGLQMALGASLAAARGWSHPEYEADLRARARAGVPDRRVA